MSAGILTTTKLPASKLHQWKEKQCGRVGGMQVRRPEAKLDRCSFVISSAL